MTYRMKNSSYEASDNSNIHRVVPYSAASYLAIIQALDRMEDFK